LTTFRDSAAALAENGYQPVPLHARSKRPIPNGWQNYRFAPGDEQAVPATAGVGILAGVVAPIDIDVMRADLVNQVRAHVEAITGPLPARIGQAPKVMLLARVREPIRKLASLRFRFADDPPGQKPHGIEILGQGNQFVAYGIHPDTGNEYTWNGAGTPLEVPLAQLPLITHEELANLVEWINRLLADAGGIPIGAIARSDRAQATPADELEAHDAAECAQAIANIPNADLPYDDWVYLGHAIKGALGEAGRNAWHEWSSRSAKYDYDETERAWISFKPVRIGAGTLYRLAFTNGWNRPRANVDISALLTPKPAPSELLLDVNQLRKVVGRLDWLVKHVIPAASIGLFYGPSGAFKSFVALDLALTIAHGGTWCGRRTQQGGVVYLAAEGGVGLLRRIDAWHRKQGIEIGDIPFRVCIVALQLDRAQDLQAISDAIAASAEGIGRPQLVVVDTVSQTMAGDENEARDMAIYLRGIGAGVRSRFDAAVVAVHHTGHSNGDRPRGSSVLKANVDFLFAIDRPEGSMLASFECRKQKDGDNPPAAVFDLDRIELGKDEDGEPFSSLVACFHDNAGAILAAAKTPKSKSRYAETLLALVPSAPVHKQTLRMDFYEKLGEMDYESKRKAFYRTFQELKETGRVDDNGKEAWLAMRPD